MATKFLTAKCFPPGGSELIRVRDSGIGHVHSSAAEWHALGAEALALAAALGQRAVSADHSPPGEVGIVALEEDRAGEARGAGRDVAVGADEARWDLADAGENFE